MTKKPRKVKRTVKAQHKRRVHVYGWAKLPRGWVSGLSVQAGFDDTDPLRGRPGAAMIAWLSRAELRKIRDALNAILGSRR
jgi:hypothetical protein